MVTIGRPLQSSASSTDVKTLRKPTRQKVLTDRVEDRLWGYFDHVEGIGSYVQTLSNTADIVSYFPALEGGAEPTQVGGEMDENGDPVPPTSDEAKILAVWDSIGGEQWVSEAVAAFVKHLSIPGQGWLVPVKPDSDEIAELTDGLSDVEWHIWSTSELRESLSIRGDGQIPISNERIWRIWAPHPKDSNAVTSPVRRVADKCELLRLIDQGRTATLRSRLHAGVLPIPSRLRDETTVSGQLWADALEDALLAPIDDPESTASLVPLMVYLEKDEAEILRQGPIKMGIDDPERLNELEERALRRLAIGIDAPIELITGIADLNHWSAWIVREETYDQHLDPLIVRILRSLTPWWRSILKAHKAPWENQVIWRNAATVIHKADVFDTAVQLHDRFVLSDAALLRSVDRDESDKPDEDELTRRILTKALASPLALSAVPAVGEQAKQIVSGTPEPPSLQAAAGRELDRLSRRLSNIDGEVLERMEREAAKQMRRLRRKIVDRIAAAAKKAGHEIGDPDTLPLRLGPKTVGELISGDLAAPEDFDVDRFDKIIGDAQDATTKALSKVGADKINADPHRADAVRLLAALLTTALISGLYHKTSTSGEEGFDGTELVSFTDLREALNVAGGGQAKRAVDVYELIGNGKHTVEALDRVGIGTEAFQWVYGTIPRRTFQPHLNLDGEIFERWDDPVLKQTTETWVGGEYWYVGDHRGCRCRYRRVLVQT